MIFTIYVDSLYGSDSFNGTIYSPVRTLSYALSQVYEGGKIILQEGDGTSYGNITLTKTISIKAAYGSNPLIGTVTVSGYQCLIEGLTFSGIADGLIASNLSLGSVIVRNCTFNNVDNPISIDSINYISIHRNYFDTFYTGISITSGNEVCISSNIFTGGMRSIFVSTVVRLDLWKNTVYGAADLPAIPDPDENLRIIYKTLTSYDILYKRLQLPGYASATDDGKYDVAFNVVNGPSFNYDTDFTVLYFGSLISWDGYQLEQEFAEGDVVRVMYSEAGDVESGDAIRVQDVADENSRIDSNSISGTINLGIETPVGTGVFLNTPVKIRYNNFDMVDVWWKGANPTGDTGISNIGETALYVDPNNGDFKLQDTSPNIDHADSDRWNNIYQEMGIIKEGGHYTGSYTGMRDHVSPFDRDLDYSFFHRGATGIQGESGDIGAFEYNHNETTMGNYVAEYGYDISYPGSETGPYATVDRGYERTGLNDLYVDTSIVPYQETGLYNSAGITGGTKYGRYRSKEIVLSDGDIVVGNRTKNDFVIIYPSYPSFTTGMAYVSPNGNDSWTGSISSPYRTISRALNEGVPNILVEPGYYPAFRGVTGVRLIGIEKNDSVNLNGIYYSNARDSGWTGIGTYTLHSNGIDLISSGVTGSDVIGEFSISSGIDIKLFTEVNSTYLMIKVFNGDNSIYAKINKLYSRITYGYSVGGVTYEISNGITDTFTNIRIRFVINGNNFTIYSDGDSHHNSYSNTFSSGSVTDWMIEFKNTGVGTDVVTNLSSLSGTITGATGISSTSTLKKLFAIMGSTGAQG